jgi:predicted dehydrogenase
MVRLAIVGIGGYGFSLVHNIIELSRQGSCKLVAAADSQLARFGENVQFLRSQGVELFDDALAMFRQLQGRCDGVYIATGIGSHTFLTVEALTAGYPVHLEKPPAAAVQDVDAMLAAMKQAGQFCLVGFQGMHAADIRFIKDRIVAGKLGRVRSIVCHAGWPRDAQYYGRNDWSGRLKAGAHWVLDGPATNALAHQITNMLLLASPRAGQLAEVTRAHAELYRAGDTDSHDTAAIGWTTAEGADLHLYVSHRTQDNWGPIIDVQAERGAANWQTGKGATIAYADGRTETCPPDEKSSLKMVENFVTAVTLDDGALLRCPLAEARKMVLALDAAHESSGRVHLIADNHWHRVDAGTPRERIVVDGLDDVIRQSAAAKCLPSQLPSPPAWAVATLPFEVGDYRNFPQWFAAT